MISTTKIIEMTERTGLINCIDDAFLERGDWVPIAEDFVNALLTEVNKELVQLRAELQTYKSLQEPVQPPQYGCHVDVLTRGGGFPDDCVFDSWLINDCACAVRLQAEGKGKNDCKYWQPIVISKYT